MPNDDQSQLPLWLMIAMELFRRGSVSGGPGGAGPFTMGSAPGSTLTPPGITMTGSTTGSTTGFENPIRRRAGPGALIGY
jgi:hypothetical protein